MAAESAAQRIYADVLILLYLVALIQDFDKLNPRSLSARPRPVQLA
jgi:hypothetical protein